MSSLRRTISSRPNGARSRGPTAPTGKTLSSRNATRPGLEEELLSAFSRQRRAWAIGLMHHYGTRLHRIFQRAPDNLILMRSLQELNPPENSRPQNEPSPISGHLVQSAMRTRGDPPPRTMGFTRC